MCAKDYVAPTKQSVEYTDINLVACLIDIKKKLQVF